MGDADEHVGGQVDLLHARQRLQPAQLVQDVAAQTHPPQPRQPGVNTWRARDTNVGRISFVCMMNSSNALSESGERVIALSETN